MPLSKVHFSCPRARDVLMRKSLPNKGCRSLELNAQQRNQNRYAHGEAWGMRGKPRASMHGQHEARMMERTSSERSASGPAMRPLVPPIDDVLAPSLQSTINHHFFTTCRKDGARTADGKAQTQTQPRGRSIMHLIGCSALGLGLVVRPAINSYARCRRRLSSAPPPRSEGSDLSYADLPRR